MLNVKRALHYTGRLYDEFVFLRAVFFFSIQHLNSLSLHALISANKVNLYFTFSLSKSVKHRMEIKECKRGKNKEYAIRLVF